MLPCFWLFPCANLTTCSLIHIYSCVQAQNGSFPILFHSFIHTLPTSLTLFALLHTQRTILHEHVVLLYPYFSFLPFTSLQICSAPETALLHETLRCRPEINLLWWNWGTLKCENKDVKAGRHASNFRVNNGNDIDCLLLCSGHTMGKKAFPGKEEKTLAPLKELVADTYVSVMSGPTRRGPYPCAPGGKWLSRSSRASKESAALLSDCLC